ncbi:hypothetical protein [Metabacillus sp. RGM 3146]|uniref:hypothetical protein n=1 Tax=Metabacillus sp. RGM 3146 TaxID=3401092 RepID=UPI003B9C3136
MQPKLFYHLIILISWGTLPFLGLKSIRRFLPAALFMSFVMAVFAEIVVFRTRFYHAFRQASGHLFLKFALPMVSRPKYRVMSNKV